MSRINPHVAHNVRITESSDAAFKAALFANNNTGERDSYRRRSPFHDSPPFSFYIEIRLQSRYVGTASGRAVLTSILSIPLIDISIPNVNTDLTYVSSACTRVAHERSHARGSSGVSRGYTGRKFTSAVEA